MDQSSDRSILKGKHQQTPALMHIPGMYTDTGLRMCAHNPDSGFTILAACSIATHPLHHQTLKFCEKIQECARTATHSEEEEEEENGALEVYCSSWPHTHKN